MPEITYRTRSFSFDQMAVLVKDRIDNPAEATVDRYVGLEHLDSDSLKIRRWGEPSDVEATKLLFKSGDIIFGRRRVYQRKLAVADFDGICSAHAMVLRAKPKVVLPEFLPFFMQSDLFMERALEISVGSLSPTINWKTLAKQEFALPPLEEQRRIAEALQTSRHLQDTLGSLANRLLEIRRSAQSRLLFPSLPENSRAFVRLEDIAEINPTDPPLDENAPFFPMDALDEWERDIQEHEPRGTRGGVRARSGDVLMARITPCLENGKTAQVPTHIDRCGGSTEFIVFRPRAEVPKNYLYWLITSDRIRNAAISMMCGTTGRQRVSGSDLTGILIPRIDSETKAELPDLIDTIDALRIQARERAKTSLAMHFCLVNQLVGGYVA